VIRVALVSDADLAPELAGTVLFRQNVERVRASRLEEVQSVADAGQLDVVVVDSALANAAGLVAALRQDPVTRATAVVVLGRTEFGFDHLDLLEAGANAILPLPPGRDWDDRLVRLIHVPVRRAARFPVDMAIEGGLNSGLTFTARALNLSVHGLLLESPHPLDVGEDLRFSFLMPGVNAVICGTGTVIRAAGTDRFGVELTHVDGDGRVRIKRYVESSPSD